MLEQPCMGVQHAETAVERARAQLCAMEEEIIKSGVSSRDCYGEEIDKLPLEFVGNGTLSKEQRMDIAIEELRFAQAVSSARASSLSPFFVQHQSLPRIVVSRMVHPSC